MKTGEIGAILTSMGNWILHAMSKIVFWKGRQIRQITEKSSSEGKTSSLFIKNGQIKDPGPHFPVNSRISLSSEIKETAKTLEGNLKKAAHEASILLQLASERLVITPETSPEEYIKQVREVFGEEITCIYDRINSDYHYFQGKKTHPVINESIKEGNFLRLLQGCLSKINHPYRLACKDANLTDYFQSTAKKDVEKELQSKRASYFAERQNDFNFISSHIIDKKEKELFRLAFENGLYDFYIDSRIFPYEDKVRNRPVDCNCHYVWEKIHHEGFRQIEMSHGFLANCRAAAGDLEQLIAKGKLHKKACFWRASLQTDVTLLKVPLPQNFSPFGVLASKKIDCRTFDSYKKEVFKKFEPEIARMEEIGISRHTITKAIAHGNFCLLLWECSGLARSRRRPFQSPDFCFQATEEWLGWHKKVKQLIGTSDSIDSLKNSLSQEIEGSGSCSPGEIRNLIEMVKFFRINDTSDKRLKCLGFDRHFKPSSELDLNDIKKIDRKPPSGMLNSITVTMNDGRVCSIDSRLRNQFYKIEDYKIPQPLFDEFLQSFAENRKNFASIQSSTFTGITEGFSELIRQADYEYPLGFQDCIGRKIDGIERDLQIKTLELDIQAKWSWEEEKIKYMRRSVEDYVDGFFREFSEFLPEFTGEGFTPVEVREAIKKGHFFLLLKICRMPGKKSESARERYSEIGATDERIENFLSEYREWEQEFYRTDIETLERTVNKRHKTDYRFFRECRDKGLYLYWVAKTPPLRMSRELATRAARNGELHRFIRFSLKLSDSGDRNASQLWNRYVADLGMSEKFKEREARKGSSIEKFSETPTFPWPEDREPEVSDVMSDEFLDRAKTLEESVKNRLAEDLRYWNEIAEEFPEIEWEQALQKVKQGDLFEVLSYLNAKYRPGRKMKSAK